MDTPERIELDMLRHLCADAGVAIVAADAALRITYWNPSATRLLGASRDSMIGQPITEIVPAQRRELAQRLLTRALDRGEVNEFEFEHSDPYGRKVDLAVTVSPILDDQGQISGISVILRNLTRRLDYERQQAQSQKMSALGVMAGAVAHHFNNLFGGIITSIDFAKESSDSRALRRALQTTAASLERATEMTVRLLAFAEGDHTVTHNQDLTATVREYLENHRSELETRHIELQPALEEVGVELPQKLILNILDNLISNACEAMSTGGTLGVELHRVDDGNTILLRITDSGIGLTDEQIGRAFEPFYTSKGQEAGGESHTGLGLAVVHGIVKDLGGSVTLSSSEGGGAVCTIRIPTSCSTRRANPSP